VPLDHGRRLHQHHEIQAAWSDPVKPDLDYAVDGEQPNTTGMLTAQHGQLMAECDDLQLQSSAAATPMRQPEEEF